MIRENGDQDNLWPVAPRVKSTPAAAPAGPSARTTEPSAILGVALISGELLRRVGLRGKRCTITFSFGKFLNFDNYLPVTVTLLPSTHHATAGTSASTKHTATSAGAWVVASQPVPIMYVVDQPRLPGPHLGLAVAFVSTRWKPSSSTCSITKGDCSGSCC